MLRGLRAAALLGAVLPGAHRPGRPSEGMRREPPGQVPPAAITGATRAKHVAMLARVAAGRKHCPRCCPPGETLPLGAFGVGRGQPDGHAGWCKQCKAADERQRCRQARAGELAALLASPEIRACCVVLRWRFGLDDADAARMAELIDRQSCPCCCKNDYGRARTDAEDKGTATATARTRTSRASKPTENVVEISAAGKSATAVQPARPQARRGSQAADSQAAANGQQQASGQARDAARRDDHGRGDRGPYVAPLVTWPDGTEIRCQHKYRHESRTSAQACRRRIRAAKAFVK
jgi:hypothetical protein